MKRFAAVMFGLTLATAPALAFAQNWQTVAQLTALAATLEAQQNSITSGQPLACAVLFSAAKVKAGGQVAIAWGSVGALDPLTSSTSIPMWSPNGVSTISISKPGTWSYSFTFYSASGASTTCSAQITVTK